MNFFILSTWLVGILCISSFAVCSAATDLESTDDLAPEHHKVLTHSRQKRATCDLLSLSVAGYGFNDSACAAHCLFLGKKGGYCNPKKVCVCRN